MFVPVAGALLADWGADVVRVDSIKGDLYRGLRTQGIGADSTGVNLSVALANRGKRSIALDVRTAAGSRALHQLVEGADVLLTSLRLGALPASASVRTRCGRGTVARLRRVTATASAQFGRHAGLRRLGLLYAAGTSRFRRPPVPPPQRGAMGDRNGGMALAFDATALLKRERTGAGSVVDVSLLATAMWTLSSDLLSALQGRPEPSTRTATPNPLVATYRTKDGRHIQPRVPRSDRYWRPLCEVMGRAELGDDPGFADQAARPPTATPAWRSSTRSSPPAPTTRKDFLARIDASWAPVQAVEELLDDPQVVANGYIGEVEGDGGGYRLPRGLSSSTSSRPRSGGRPSTVSTPRRSSSKLGYPGTTSPRSGTAP